VPYLKTNVHFLLYLAQFFVQLEMFQTELWKKSQDSCFCSITFFRKPCRLWDNTEK